VIVGRAANFLLKDRKNLVPLFLYASGEVRIENLMEMYGDTRAEAAKNIKSSDHFRAAY
jgi:cytidylate kinase